MPDLPLDKSVSKEEHGESYILIPYGIQQDAQTSPILVGCHIYTFETELLQTYYLAEDGWELIEESKISPSNIFYQTVETSFFQTVFCVTGDSWKDVSKHKSLLDMSIGKEESESTLKEFSTNFSPTEVTGCACERSQTKTFDFYQFESQTVELEICTSCGQMITIEHWDGGKIQQRHNVPEFSLQDDSIDPRFIIEAENHDELYFITNSTGKIDSQMLSAIPFWWESQKQNADARQYIPHEMNFTLCCVDESIVGVVFWSYVLDRPTVAHVWFTEPEYLEPSITEFNNEFSETVYLKQPFTQSMALTDMTFMTGSISVKY